MEDVALPLAFTPRIGQLEIWYHPTEGVRVTHTRWAPADPAGKYAEVYDGLDAFEAQDVLEAVVEAGLARPYARSETG